MSYIPCDTDGNCRITENEVPELDFAAADILIEEEVSSDKEEHMGEIREIMPDKQREQVGDAAQSHRI